MNSLMRSAAGVFFILALMNLFAQPVVAEAPSIDLSSGLFYDNNLSNAERSSDIEEDYFWSLNAGATWSGLTGNEWRTSVRVFTGAEVPFEYSAFTLGRAGADARLSRKFGLGANASRASGGVSFERDFFHDQDMSSWLLVPSVKWTHHLTALWSADLLYRVDVRYAESNLYSGHGHEGGLLLRGNPGERWSFASGIGIRYGDVVSYATPPRPDIKPVSSIIEPDNMAFDRPLTAYRLDALTRSISVGTAYALTPDISLELNGKFQYITRSDFSYDDITLQLALKSVF